MRSLILISHLLFTAFATPMDATLRSEETSSPTTRSYLQVALGELPAGWEQRNINSDGAILTSYFNSNTNETRVRDPRLQDPPTSPNRHPQLEMLPTSRTILKVDRSSIFETAFSEIMTRDPRDLRCKRLEVIFVGEPAIDEGGVSNDFFHQMGLEISNPAYALFEFDEAKSGLKINPSSGIANDAHLFYFQFIGRIIGLAIYHLHSVDAVFIAPYYKILLGKELTFADLEFDRVLYQNLLWLQNNSVKDLDMNFAVEIQRFGSEIEYVDLKLDGSSILVDDDNKFEYLNLLSKWKIQGSVRDQLQAFKHGFNEIFPNSLTHILPRQLELMISGVSKLDTDDWKDNTEYLVNGMPKRVIGWFWKFVQSLDEEGKARLLQFVTGSSRVPAIGFKNLHPRKFNLFLTNLSHDALPSAHTCFNRIDIPKYLSYEEMVSKLHMAIYETSGFGQAR